MSALTSSGAGEYICELAYRQGGLFTVHDLAHMTEPLPSGSIGTFADLKKVLTDADIRNLIAVSLQTFANMRSVSLYFLTPNEKRSEHRVRA